jgi:hypothetical protein
MATVKASQKVFTDAESAAYTCAKPPSTNNSVSVMSLLWLARERLDSARVAFKRLRQHAIVHEWSVSAELRSGLPLIGILDDANRRRRDPANALEILSMRPGPKLPT